MITPHYVSVTMTTIASTITDRELLRIIETNYPNMAGALKEMRNRFESLLNQTTDKLPVEIECFHCGSTLTLRWDVEA